MRLSTKTILLLGVIQCIVLTLILIVFLRYQQTVKSEQSPVSGVTPTIQQ